MWRWLPPTWRVPLAVKIVLLVLLALVPYLLLPQLSLPSVRELAQAQQEHRLEEVADSLAVGLGDQARRIQESLEGIVNATTTSHALYALQFAQSAEAAINAQQALTQQLIPEAQIIAGLDYLAISEPNAERYLASGSNRNLFNLPMPPNEHVIRGPRSMELPTETTNPPKLWVWGIEFHEDEDGAQFPMLVVAGPIYAETVEQSGTWRIVGYIAGGRKIDAPLLGNPEGAGDVASEVVLADEDGRLIWSSYKESESAEALLRALIAQGPLAHHPPSKRLGAGEAPLLISTINLNAEPSQSPAWLDDTFLVAVQPEGQFTQQLAQIRRVLLLAAAGSALLALAVALIVTAGLSRPLQQLAQAAGQFARGEPVPFEVPATRDEVETLAQAFVAMVEDRERSTARIIQAEKLAAWRDVARKLAHEIKNPLQPIRLQVESLVRMTDKRPENLVEMLPEAAEIVLFEVDRLKHLADEFSAFARMPQPILEPTAIEPLLQRVANLSSVAHPGILIGVEVPPEMPLLAVDPEKITQAVLNLVKNAAEALTDAGTVDPHITCAADLPEAGGATIAVVDNGPGLAAEVKDRLFTPELTTKVGGSGWGLVVVQQVMSEHGGAVIVEGTPGGGTTFILEFPANLIVAPQG